MLEIMGVRIGWRMKILVAFVGLLLVALIGLGLFRGFFVDFVDNYEIGYKYDRITGKIEVLQKKGYVVNPPVIVNIHTVDLRPMQVCINANARVLNCKLVQFDPNGLELFLSWHGRDNYPGPSSTGISNLSEILKSYAFEGTGKVYPFLKVIRELKPEEVQHPLQEESK